MKRSLVIILVIAVAAMIAGFLFFGVGNTGG